MISRLLKMKTKYKRRHSVHQEISLLLPWYVSRTLDDKEKLLVEKHLKGCLICRIEIENLHKIASAVKQADSFESAAQASFRKLRHRLHNTEKQRQNDMPSFGLGWWRPKVFWFQRSVFAVTAVLLLTLLIPSNRDDNSLLSGNYRTLSDSENVVDRDNEIRVVFSKDTDEQQRDEILASVRGWIVTGPTPQGVYSVGLESKQSTKILKIIEQLRADAHVVFAEPSYSILSSNEDSRVEK